MERIFNHYKIKYRELGEYFNNKTFSKFKYANLYINLDSVIKKIITSIIINQETGLSRNEQVSLVYNIMSGIVNLGAHYRNFFNNNKIPSNIFFYYGDYETSDLYNNNIHIKNYRNHYLERFNKSEKFPLVNEVKEALKVTPTIISYIEHMYMIKSSKLEPSAVPLLLMKSKWYNRGINFILTGDEYDFQYVNFGAVLLLPDYDIAKIVTRRNIISFIKNKYGIVKSDYEINPLLIPLMYALNGNKDRNIEKLPAFRMKKIYKNMETLYKKDLVDDDNPSTFLIESLSEYFRSALSVYEEDPKLYIGKNYFATDIYRQVQIVDDLTKEDIFSQLEDKYDPKALKALNDTDFDEYDCPLMLDQLNQYVRSIDGL